MLATLVSGSPRAPPGVDSLTAILSHVNWLQSRLGIADSLEACLCPDIIKDSSSAIPTFAIAPACRNGEMAVGLASNVSHNALDEEARAEVDVLNSRLDKTTQLTKKIQACLGRLDATGQSVREVAGPLNGETRRLQVLGTSELPPRLPSRWSLTQNRC